MDKVKCMQDTQIHKVNRGKPGKWKNCKADEYIKEINVDNVSNIIEKANGMSVTELNNKLKHTLIDPTSISTQEAKKVYKV